MPLLVVDVLLFVYLSPVLELPVGLGMLILETSVDSVVDSVCPFGSVGSTCLAAGPFESLVVLVAVDLVEESKSADISTISSD